MRLIVALIFRLVVTELKVILIIGPVVTELMVIIGPVVTGLMVILISDN